MKKLLLVLGLFTINYTTSAQTVSYASPLTQTDIVNAELILPNGVITNPAYDYYSPYEVIKQKAGYLITPTEMQSAGFVNNDEIRNLSWTLSQGQQNETSGFFRLYIKNTLDVTNTGLQIGNFAHQATITIPAQAGQLTFDFFSPFIYTGGGLYIYYEFTADGYSGWTPMLQTAVNTNLTDGYRVQAVLGGEYQGYVINSTHSNRPITTLGKLSCIFSGYSAQSFTENTVTLAWQGMGNYEIEYGPRPYVQGTGGTSISSTSTTNENTYVLTNLAPGTAYDIYMRKICNATESSGWMKGLIGTSNSGPITTFPYLENFDSGVAQTIGWENVLNTGLNWGIYADGNVNGGRLGLKDWMGGINHKTIYSRPIQLTAGTNYTISFDYSILQLGDYINSANSPDLEVILTTSTAEESSTIVSTISQISNSQNQTFTSTFTAPTSGIYYIGLKGLFNQNPTQDPSLGEFVLSGLNYLLVDNFSLDKNLGIEDNTFASFTIYPNPTENMLHFSQPLRNITIYDLTGRNIRSYADIQDKIDVSELAHGNYIVQGYQASGEKVIKKFIKN